MGRSSPTSRPCRSKKRMRRRPASKSATSFRFDIGGVPVDARVASIRRVEWDSMAPNFFILFSPGALRDVPATYMTSFYLPPQDKAFLNQSARRVPHRNGDRGRQSDCADSVDRRARYAGRAAGARARARGRVSRADRQHPGERRRAAARTCAVARARCVAAAGARRAGCGVRAARRFSPD